MGLCLLVQCSLGARTGGNLLTRGVPGCSFPVNRQTLVVQLKALKGKAEQQQLKAQTVKEMQILSQEEVSGSTMVSTGAPDHNGWPHTQQSDEPC